MDSEMAVIDAVEALAGDRPAPAPAPAPAPVTLDGRVCAQCGYTYGCAAIHASHSRVTDDDIRLFSISVSCDQIGAMICGIALGDKADGIALGDKADGVIAHLTPGAARALVELEIERLRAQGSM